MKDLILKSKEIESCSNSLYSERAHSFGKTPKAVFWDNPQTQYLRFSEIVRHIDLLNSNSTILDVGCGNAELMKYLNFSGFRGLYEGVDVNQDLLQQARERFPGVSFHQLNLINESLLKAYDYVVCSGLFNLNVGQDDNWIYAFIKKMYAHAKCRVIFNAITTYVNHKETSLYYLSPTKTLDLIIREISPLTSLHHHILPYNYSVVIEKGSAWSAFEESV